VKIRPTSRDVTIIENSQESNKSIKSLVNVSVQNVSNSPRSVELFDEFDCANDKTEEVTNKDYKRESLDLFEGSFEHTKFSITVNVSQKYNSDNLSDKSISESYLAELMNIKTPKELEEKWDCNIGGEIILEMSQRDFGSKKRKREEEAQTENNCLNDIFIEPRPKCKKIEESSTSCSKPEINNSFESTMFPDSIRIDTQLDQLLNGSCKTNTNLNIVSTEMSESVMQMAFQNSFNSMSNTIISPKKSNVAMTCKDLVISDSEDMIAGSQDTSSSGPSPRKYDNVLATYKIGGQLAARVIVVCTSFLI